MTSILKVDNLQNANGSNLINESGSIVTIGANGNTVALAAGATQTGFGGVMTPAFQAEFQAGDQTISNNTNTKVIFSVETFDTDNKYDTSTYRFTPGTIGKYFVYANLLPQVGAYSCDIEIWKNGSELQNGRIGGTSVDPVSNSVCGIVNITNITDYIEIYAWQNSGSNKIIYGSSTFGRFGAFKIIGA